MRVPRASRGFWDPQRLRNLSATVLLDSECLPRCLVRGKRQAQRTHRVVNSIDPIFYLTLAASRRQRHSGVSTGLMRPTRFA